MKLWLAPTSGQVPHAEYGAGHHDVARLSQRGRLAVYVTLTRRDGSASYVVERWSPAKAANTAITKPLPTFDEALRTAKMVFAGAAVPVHLLPD